MSDIELRELRVFLTLTEELHFGRTAERLGLTQSRVSQSLRALEHKIGEELVHRTSRRVALTAAGERFQADVGPLIAQLTTVLERAHGAARQLEGALRIGVMYPNAGGEQLIKIIESFEASSPHCHVQIKETPLGDPAAPLHRGDIDLMVTPVLTEPTGVVVRATLSVEPRVLAVAHDHPLAQRAEISIEDLAEYEVAAPSILPDELQEAWIPFETPSGRPIRRLASRTSSIDQIAMLVARGKVVFPTVPSTSAYFGNAKIVHIPIAGLPPSKVVLISRPESWDPRMREFTRVAHAVLDALPLGST
jgi:DNA-binding transcriptional LysR family regulator